MTPEQILVLGSSIAADPSLSSLDNTPDNAQVIADAYNAAASPGFWVYRTSVTHREIVEAASVDSTFWNWSAYIARSQGERDAWRQLFSNPESATNFSLQNVRQAMADIFSGTQNNAPSQRTHLQAVSRRLATRAEKLFATGTGSTADPATMQWEGSLTASLVQRAR